MKNKKIRKKLYIKIEKRQRSIRRPKKGGVVYHLANAENGKQYTRKTVVSYLYLLFVVYGSRV